MKALIVNSPLEEQRDDQQRRGCPRCFFRNNSLFINNGRGEIACGPRSTCYTGRTCSRSAAISYDSCLCGSAICTKESGLLCYLLESS